MKINLLAKFSLVNLYRNKKSYSIISVLIIFGCFALIAASSFIQYSFAGLSESFIRQGLGHFQIMHQKEYEDKSTYALEYGLTTKQVKNIEKILSSNFDDEVEYVMKRINFSGIVSSGEKSSIFLGRGLEPVKESVFSSAFVKVKNGKYLGANLKSDGNEIVLGQELSDILSVKVGDYISLMVTTSDGALNAIDLKLVGMVKTGIKDMDKRLVLVDLKTAKELLRSSSISKVVVGLYDLEGGKSIESFVGKKIANMNSMANVKSYYWEDLSDFYGSVVSLYNSFFIFLGSLIVIIVISTVFGSIYTSIMERVREIGILKANGFSNNDIRILVILEVTYLAIISIILAYIFSFAMMFVVNNLNLQMPPAPGSTRGYPFGLLYIFKDALYVCLVIAAATVLASLKPVFYASNLKIADALRQ